MQDRPEIVATESVMICSDKENVNGGGGKRPTLVLVSKYPTPGSSKTRLIPAFGTALAAQLAMAMLTDLLRRFSNEDTDRVFRKVFVYAPPSAGPAVQTMLKDLGLDKTWDAEPVSAGTALRESGLTTILEAALASARSRERDGAVIFVGMDTPELPWSEVMAAKSAAEKDGKAYICPASDGGYTLLGLPPTAGQGTFEGVKWSDALTCKSQTCALASRGVLTRIGGTYHDVDEADDVAGLERRSPRGLAEQQHRSQRHTFSARIKFCFLSAPDPLGLRTMFRSRFFWKHLRSQQRRQAHVQQWVRSLQQYQQQCEALRLKHLRSQQRRQAHVLQWARSPQQFYQHREALRLKHLRPQQRRQAHVQQWVRSLQQYQQHCEALRLKHLRPQHRRQAHVPQRVQGPAHDRALQALRQPNPHDRGDMPKYLPDRLTQYVLNNFTTPPPPISRDPRRRVSAPLAARGEKDHRHGHQSVRGSGGVIAVMYETHRNRLSRSSWEREMDLQLSRQQILLYWAANPNQHRRKQPPVSSDAHWSCTTGAFPC
eukprot:jgi/Undpi1/6258/HiC_scaffold_20.g08742.m1